VNFFIARDGEEIGEWPRAELNRLARSGELRPTDYYWTEGMENWRQLSDLLPEELWDTPDESPAARPAIAATQKLQIDGEVAEPGEEISEAAGGSGPPVSELLKLPAVRYALAAVALLLVVRAVYALWPEGANANPPVLLDKAAEKEPASEREDRDRAAADLRQRLEKLPSRAVEPANTFYFDLRVRMSRSPARDARWRAVITGSEHIVDPAQDKVVRQTLFTLTTDYREEGWTFHRYEATMTNLETLENLSVEHDATTEAPPSLATIIGLRFVRQ
jgi:hypothetical protein